MRLEQALASLIAKRPIHKLKVEYLMNHYVHLAIPLIFEYSVNYSDVLNTVLDG